jgi:hypothetical protein
LKKKQLSRTTKKAATLPIIIIINRMTAEELTEYLIASQIDFQVRKVLDRFWSSLM